VAARTGRTTQAPPATLARLDVVDAGVATDPETGSYLAELVAGEARWLCSPVNAVPNGVVRHLAGLLLDHACPERRAEVAAMTDDEFWALLLTDPATASHARELRRDPAGWRTTGVEDSTAGGFSYALAHLYLDMPLVNGDPLPATHPAFGQLPTMPWSCRIIPPTAATTHERSYPTGP